MGTSKGYQAPTSPQWRQVKLEVTRAAGAGSVPTTRAQGIVSNFIRANGGSHGLSGGEGGSTSTGTSAAKRTGRNLARFAGIVGTRGLDQALQEFGLERLVGKSAREITLTLVNELCGDGSTLDEVDARKAMADLTTDLLNGATTYEDVVRALEQQMRSESLGNLLFRFFGHYLYSRFCRVFYERLIRRHGETTATGFLKDIRDTIVSMLRYKTYERDLTSIAWAGPEGNNIIQDILKVTLEAFEG